MKSGGDDDALEGPQAAPLSLSDATRCELPRRRPAASDAPPPPFPILPRDPDRYHLLGEHGRGGLGRVSRAHDRELGRDIAIKELISRGEIDEVRFLREALITARLEHPGIVPVYEAGRWPDGTPFYAMKLVSGRSLRELIAERTTVEECVGLLHHVIAVADAIAYAHGRAIIHRDLKPANVIVGEFGETIVIDWGLAKDLTVDEDPVLGDGPLRVHGDDSLTMAGSVLGTPAYMAPEQARGEHVDRRADVYAIGTMLWELCTVRKRPPARAQQRHGMLRAAGIDEDLATIINKALEPDPDRRYPDAGALAADLKAFKSGARIAARSYSLYATLAHWTRRHRTLAGSVLAVVALVVTGTSLFVRNIAVERDRADSSEAIARRARATAENSLDELTLKHAQLLLATDPSAAIDVLKDYHGRDGDRAAQIRAEAAGRGVALTRAQPHTADVLWAEGASDGSIISLSRGGTIARTSRDGQSTVVARGVSRSGIPAYSRTRKLLAYTCDPVDLCLFDVARVAAIPPAPVLRGVNAIASAFSPDGTLLALISQDGVLRILDLGDPAHPEVRLTRPVGGLDVEFVGANTVAVGDMAGVHFMRTTGEVESFAIQDIARWNAGDGKLAIMTERGQALVLESFPVRVAARATLCHGPLADFRFASATRIAYACREGVIGIWDLAAGTVTPRAQLEGHADLIATSPDGEYILAVGSNGTMVVLDLVTDLISSYRGHGRRVTALAPPTSDHPFLVSGDMRGAVRAWPVPPRLARVAATTISPFYAAIFNGSSATVTATTWLPALTVYSPASGARTAAPHEPHNIDLAQSSSGGTFASYGLHDLVELWSSATMTRITTIATGHGSISQLSFIDGSEDFLTAGHAGGIARWTPAGAKTVIAALDQPVDRFAVVRATGAIVFGTSDGALWRTEAGQLSALGTGGARINQLVAVDARHAVYAGYTNGDVVALDTRTWRSEMLLQVPGEVQEIATTTDGRVVAIATGDGAIHIATGAVAARPSAMTWSTLPVSAHHIALTSDGVLVAVCTDGTIWLYDTDRRHSLCVPTGTADFGQTAVSADGKAAVALDREGRLLWIDLASARRLLDTPPPITPPVHKDT
ncbi:MAG TPA: WD40 repeat domain-containing serine/threonine protein kinase [Kofleriaceae bacterium]|nr:WD40 repeat domain-containing serine/threonine protein kinase [Kofleriaceae bacterium]